MRGYSMTRSILIGRSRTRVPLSAFAMALPIAGQCAGFARVDPDELGVWERAAQRFGVKLAGKFKIGNVADLAADEPGFARVTHARPARPPDRDVAGLSELQQARERRIPGDRQVAAAEEDGWARARVAGRKMR